MGKSRKAKTVALLWRFVVFLCLISYSNAFQVNIEKITRIYNAPNLDLRLDKDPRFLKKELNLEQQRKTFVLGIRNTNQIYFSSIP